MAAVAGFLAGVLAVLMLVLCTRLCLRWITRARLGYDRPCDHEHGWCWIVGALEAHGATVTVHDPRHPEPCPHEPAHRWGTCPDRLPSRVSQPRA
jgi:hypothetical protein